MKFLKLYGRRIFVYAAYIILFTTVQAVLSGWLVEKEFMPDLVLVLVIISGSLFGSYDGMIIGLIAGFLRDMLAGRVLGLGMLLFMFAGLIAASFLIRFFRRNFLLALLQVFFITLLYESVLVILTFLFPMLSDQYYSLRQLFDLSINTIFAKTFLNLLAALPLILFLHYLGPYARGQERVDV